MLIIMERILKTIKRVNSVNSLFGKFLAASALCSLSSLSLMENILKTIKSVSSANLSVQQVIVSFCMEILHTIRK